MHQHMVLFISLLLTPSCPSPLPRFWLPHELPEIPASLPRSQGQWHSRGSHPFAGRVQLCNWCWSSGWGASRIRARGCFSGGNLVPQMVLRWLSGKGSRQKQRQIWIKSFPAVKAYWDESMGISRETSCFLKTQERKLQIAQREACRALRNFCLFLEFKSKL